jgi:hypothetical protein
LFRLAKFLLEALSSGIVKINNNDSGTESYRSFESSIKTFDFSTLYTTLPHDKLKTCLKEIMHKAFSHRNYGSKCVVLGYNSTYFSNKIQKGKTCYSEEQVISRIPEKKILI